MGLIEDKMTDKITLHGLGFVQVQLEADQRLHVWHPELPRRRCFDSSAIHDHRFDFTSRVLVGEQNNLEYQAMADPEGDYVLYLHEGARTACGGRPWVPDGRVTMRLVGKEVVPAGQEYTQLAYRYHRTVPGGNGRVATIMHKAAEYSRGAHSSCLAHVQPHDDFDRFQWSAGQLWEAVFDVLGGKSL